ncbi:CHAT domain-containing protein [uncultured Thiothrix sp.]|uniref:CHAT domain-containing protein n=1 Tax=uncultured Thiothrix sp. TaxID=223185 RepID=UPI0026119324|nr:CHAT domain-containing protein [uncultured Thiothrix sp.]HMT91600.1 CHAT domain-containing protein [Thiolinea sp.]
MTTDNKPLKSTKRAFLIPSNPATQRGITQVNAPTLPRALASATRSQQQGRNLFMSEAAVTVTQSFDLRQGTRSIEQSTAAQFKTEELMVLEAQDGSVVIMRADKMHAELQRLYPQALHTDGQIDLNILKDPYSKSRGLGQWIWSKLSILNLSSDSFISAAQEQAIDWLEDKLGERFTDLAYAQASWIGAKALMQAIESKLEGEPGLYRWTEKTIKTTDRVTAETQELVDAAKNKEPLLIFIHGTGSNTLGSFGTLRSEAQDIHWDQLTRPFSKRIYAFEHRTLSDSPLDNALQLAKNLPKGSRFSLITHSRGGLVGDLLCLNDFDANLIKHYQRRPAENDGQLETEEQRKIRELVVAEEQQQLSELRALLLEKQFQIDRYVRVACPAGGTTLMADNIDLFLSGLLSLMSFGAGFIPVAGAVSASVLNAFRRVVLEIAAKRIDPRFIPGLEAMLPDSPITGFLATASCSDKIQVVAITGNTDSNEASILKRIAIIFTDWVLFGRIDNDFVVDTQSMRAGLAKRNNTHEFHTKGSQVSHLHYFKRPDTLRALNDWLNHENPTQLAGFTRIPTDCDIKLDSKKLNPAATRTATTSMRPKNAPIVFYLPGMMGSHLSVRPRGQNTGDRIWFDPFDLAAGGIYSLKMGMPNIYADGLFEYYYGELQQYLATHYEVIPFAYDWRLSLETLAKQFAEFIEKQLKDLDTPQQQRPVNILAHSMGGLVMRMLIASPKLSKLWENIASRPNSHFIMLGTPNQGSYAAVESLLGKGQGVRYLASLDFHHNLQEVLDVLSEYEGLLQLLPHRDSETIDYFKADTWAELQNINRDRWFGSNQALGALPTEVSLTKAKKATERLKTPIPFAERVAYVFGVEQHTPLNLELADNKITLKGTTEGDGTVTWEAGRLPELKDEQYWYMPVSHANLTNTPKYFAALAELLQTGTSTQLERSPPRQRGSINRDYPYEAGPVLHASAEEVALAFFGDRPQREPVEDTTQALKVAVRAMDLRFVQQPIICGHYQADSIASAERMIDKHLVDGALSQRERLGIYAGPVSSSTIILRPRSPTDFKRNICRGAIIVGLGEWNLITTQKITDTVRDGVLNYLLTLPINPTIEPDKTETLGVNSLLIGYNSTTHITVEASIEAIVRGICAANQQYRYNSETQPKRAINRLDFIEFYLDTAITAAYIVRELPKRLETELERLEARLEPANELIVPRYQGMRHRLSERTIGGGYWPRLMVTNAKEKEQQDQGGNQPAELLKYIYLSERARAETVIQQRQPGLIESLIRDAIINCNYKPDISRTLFQLMIPFDFKSAARQTNRLLLILDEYTANLPWEMLQADEEPLALQVQMVRQFSSTTFRRRVTTTISKTACVIANPLTSQFYRHYSSYDPTPEDKDSDKSLISLEGATREGLAVADLLTKNGYSVERCLPTVPDELPSHTALDVFNILFKKPYRILMIAAHGEVGLIGKDNKERTGVILSDGSLLTSAEISQMEEIPDLVFLNCCHLGDVSASKQPRPKHAPSFNKLAYSLARELIEMGVRCVIAAGWAVDDAAACTFSTLFFESFIEKNQTFGQAVYEARRQTRLLHEDLNTWGAYQAYGDPSFVLEPLKEKKHALSCQQQVSAYELQDYLTSIEVDMHQKVGKYEFASLHRELEQVADNLSNPEWLKTPDIQYQLASLYRNVLPEGFEAARSAYQIAIAEEDRNGKVPILALESLANLESRQAETLAFQAVELKKDNPERSNLFTRAKDLANSAIERLDGLLKITKYVQTAAAVDSLISLNSNAERFALLGSAYKRLAIILLQEDSKAWDKVEAALKHSLEAYKCGEARELGARLKAYPLINRLQLTAILQGFIQQVEDENYLELLDQAHNIVSLQFAESNEFFDTVMSADIDIARFLLDQDKANVDSKTATEFVQLYKEVTQEIPSTLRVFNSVVQQLKNLAQLLKAAGQQLQASNLDLAALCDTKANILSKIADGLEKL